MLKIIGIIIGCLLAFWCLKKMAEKLCRIMVLLEEDPQPDVPASDMTCNGGTENKKDIGG